MGVSVKFACGTLGDDEAVSRLETDNFLSVAIPERPVFSLSVSLCDHLPLVSVAFHVPFVGDQQIRDVSESLPTPWMLSFGFSFEELE